MPTPESSVQPQGFQGTGIGVDPSVLTGAVAMGVVQGLNADGVRMPSSMAGAIAMPRSNDTRLSSSASADAGVRQIVGEVEHLTQMFGAFMDKNLEQLKKIGSSHERSTSSLLGHLAEIKVASGAVSSGGNKGGVATARAGEVVHSPSQGQVAEAPVQEKSPSRRSTSGNPAELPGMKQNPYKTRLKTDLESEQISGAHRGQFRQELESGQVTMGGIGRHVAAGIDLWAHSSKKYSVSEDPESHNVSIRNKSTGKFATADEALANQSIIRRGVAKAADAANLTGIAENGLAKGIMGSAAAPYLGAAGVAYAGARFVQNRYNNFEAEGRQYQSVNGGGSARQFGAIVGAKAFSFKQGVPDFLGGSGMSSRDASELYNGVYATGMSGADRQNSLSFATSEFKKLGISVSDSLQLIQTSAENGNTSLNGLATSLAAVTKQAQATGQSAVSLQQKFASNYAAAAPVVGGTSAAGVATTLSTVGGSGLGPQFANTDTSGVLTEEQQAVQATSLGMTPAQYQAAVQRNPDLLRQSLSKLVPQRVSGVLTAQQKQVISSVVKKYGQPAIAADPGVLQSAVSEIQQKLGRDAISPEAIMAATGGLGINNLTASNAVTYAIGAGTNAIDLSDASQSAKLASQGNAVKLKGGKGNDQADAKTMDKLMGGWTTGGYFNREDKASYEGEAKKAGSFSPVIGALLKQGTYDRNEKFRVQTANGWRDVGVHDAYTNFADQLESGTATFASGKHKGKSVSDVVGFTDQGVKMDSDGNYASADNKSLGTHGKVDKLGQNGKDITGKISIDLTPTASKWFQVTGSGAGLQFANYTGTPAAMPPNPQARP